MGHLERLNFELAEAVQGARHLSDQDWRVFTAKAHEQLAVRKPWPTSFWVLQAAGGGVDYDGPYQSESEARESETFKRSWGTACIAELPREDAKIRVSSCGRLA